MTDDLPRCGCGATCWAADRDEYGPCEGPIGVSEDHPGIYVHFCERHGHPEDEDGARSPDD